MPKDPQKRFNETPWSASEDQILKSLADRYPGNWSLIADVFNSARVTISTDRRTAWDCLARWDARWNEGRILIPNSGPVTPGSVVDGATTELTAASVPATPVGPQSMLNTMMTRKRSASQLNLSVAGQQAESRKRRRHNHMHEAMRKSAKKRETSMKQIGAHGMVLVVQSTKFCLVNQNKRGPNTQVHETHAAFAKPTNRTPAEWSKIKAERDRREFEDFQQRKRQEDEMLRKHRNQMELLKQQVGTSLRGVGSAVHATPAPLSQADAVRRPQLAVGPVPIVGGTGHAQVNISQQATRLPAAGSSNMAVPTLTPSVPLATGMNVNVQNFRRLSPQQQQALYAQMQAHHMQAAQAAQAQQQHTSTPSQSGQTTMSHPGGLPSGQQRIGTPAHTSPPQTQMQTPQHHTAAQTQAQAQAQTSPPRHGTPANGVGIANALVRPGSSQHVQVQAQRAGVGVSPHAHVQARPGSSQHPQAQGVARQGAVPQHPQHPQHPQQQQHQQQHQQQALHHAFMQNQTAHTTAAAAAAHQEQMKRLYPGPLYWMQQQQQQQGAQGSQGGLAAGHMAYGGVPQQQQQQQQQHTPTRPVSAQPNSNPNPNVPSQSSGS